MNDPKMMIRNQHIKQFNYIRIYSKKKINEGRYLFLFFYNKSRKLKY